MPTLMLVLLSLLARVPGDLPGSTFARAVSPVVLRSGPSQNHPGVMTLTEGAVVRAEGLSDPFVRVYVPAGFPVYLHGDFVEIDRVEQLVRLTADRVNVRLLPAAEGLLPVGQLGQAGGELALLDEERDWVRVLAPVDLPLYAPAGMIEASADAQASGRWARLLSERDSLRARRVAAWKATDPDWQQAAALQENVAALSLVDLAQLDSAALSARRETLAALAEQAQRSSTRTEIERLQDELEGEVLRRDATLAVLEETRRREARDAANLVREARALDVGLRFLGRGEALTVEGIVRRQTSESQDATVYSLSDKQGRFFKLSSAREIADLKALLGKTVVLDGRSLTLQPVEGPVLIVDRVIRVQP